MVTLGSTCHPAGYSYLQNQRQSGETLSRACPLNWAKESTKETKAARNGTGSSITDSDRGIWQTYPRKPKPVGSDSDEAGLKSSTGLQHLRGLESPATSRFSASLLCRQSGKTSPASAALKSRAVLWKILEKRGELYGKHKGDFS